MRSLGVTAVLLGYAWRWYRHLYPAPYAVSQTNLSEEDREKLEQMPDPEPPVRFPDAIRTRKRAGGHAEASHRCATLLHLSNIAIRTGRKIRYDPVKEKIIGDEEANRLVYQPMRAPWRL